MKKKNLPEFKKLKPKETVANIANNFGSQFIAYTKQWNGFAIAWAFFALIVMYEV